MNLFVWEFKKIFKQRSSLVALWLAFALCLFFGIYQGTVSLTYRESPDTPREYGPALAKKEQALIERIREAHTPAVLAVNKIDTVPPQALLEVIAVYAAAYPFQAVVPISARTGDGMQLLLDELEKFASEGPQLFPEDMISDQPEKQICAEIVREKLLLCLDKEIPHGVAVEAERFTERENGIIDLEVTIYCEKASHKGIIIGKNGAMLRKVGEMARKDVEAFMGTKVCLRTWVKVKENWRDSQAQLRNFGFVGDK